MYSKMTKALLVWAMLLLCNNLIGQIWDLESNLQFYPYVCPEDEFLLEAPGGGALFYAFTNLNPNLTVAVNGVTIEEDVEWVHLETIWGSESSMINWVIPNTNKNFLVFKFVAFGKFVEPIQSLTYVVNCTPGKDGGKTDGLFESQEKTTAYPNPFANQLNVDLEIPKAGEVAIRIYDINGKLVETLLENHLEAGSQSLFFDVTSLNSGMYMLEIVAEDRHQTLRIVKTH